MCVCVYVHMYVCVCVYIYICNSLALSADVVAEEFLQLRNAGPVSLDSMAIISHLALTVYDANSILLWCYLTEAVLKLVKISTCQISLLEFTIIY